MNTTLDTVSMFVKDHYIIFLAIGAVITTVERQYFRKRNLADKDFVDLKSLQTKNAYTGFLVLLFSISTLILPFISLFIASFLVSTGLYYLLFIPLIILFLPIRTFKLAKKYDNLAKDLSYEIKTIDYDLDSQRTIKQEEEKIQIKMAIAQNEAIKVERAREAKDLKIKQEAENIRMRQYLENIKGLVERKIIVVSYLNTKLTFSINKLDSDKNKCSITISEDGVMLITFGIFDTLDSIPEVAKIPDIDLQKYCERYEIYIDLLNELEVKVERNEEINNKTGYSKKLSGFVIACKNN